MINLGRPISQSRTKPHWDPFYTYIEQSIGIWHGCRIVSGAALNPKGWVLNKFDQSCHLLFDLPLYFQAQIFSTCILVDADGYGIAIQQACVDGPAHGFQ